MLVSRGNEENKGFCLCASLHPCLCITYVLCTPVYPCVPLSTPVYPCVPLCTPVYPVCAHVYPCVLSDCTVPPCIPCTPVKEFTPKKQPPPYLSSGVLPRATPTPDVYPPPNIPREKEGFPTAHIECLGAYALLRGNGRVRGKCARGDAWARWHTLAKDR